MKGRLLRALLIGLCGVMSLSLSARTMQQIAMDSTIHDHKLVYFGNAEQAPADSVDSMIRKFYENQFRHFQDPLAPYFLFMSKDANLAMGVGGVVRMRAYYDWAGIVPSPGFAPYLIGMEKNPEKRRQLGTTPAGTALFFRVLGRNRKFGHYQLYIEANFNGYTARDFHLEKAYGEIGDWTIGYTNSTFSDPGALPPAIDASGPNAKMSATSVLVRYLHQFKKGWTIAASLETPSDQIEVKEGATAKVTQYVPDIATFGQYSWGESGYVRLAAIARFMPYRNLIEQRNRNVVGWGLHLSTRWALNDHFTFYGMANGGCGYASMGGDWLMGKYDLIPDQKHEGKMYAPGAIGGYAALRYDLNPSIFFSATYGATRYLPKGEMPGSEYKRGTYLALNCFWYLTPRISCGAELNLGQRVNMDGQSRWARRAGCFAQFSF